jgi:hypothetical protein
MALALSGSVSISGSLNVGGSAVVLSSATSSLSASYAVNAVTASYVVSSVTDASQNTRLTAIETVTGSYASTSSLSLTSASVAAINIRTGSYATTGSNYFIGTQVITGSVYIANDLIVQGSSSLQNITASAVSIGTNTVILNTDSPAVRFAGISVRDSGSNSSVTSSIWYDSLNNKWIYQNESGSSYSGGMFISGPRNTGSLGSEAGMDSGYIAKGLGGDHIGPSIIFESGSTNIGIGTSNPLYKLEIQTQASASGLWVQTGGTTSGHVIADFRTGTNASVLQLLGNNTAIFGGALTGTSATLSSNLSFIGSGGISFTSNDANAYPRFTGADASGQLGLFRSGTDAGGMYIGATGTSFRIFTSNFGSALMILTQTGNITFSGSATATALNLSNTDGYLGTINSTAGNGAYFAWQTSGTTIADIGTAQQIFGSGGATTFGINARGARSLIFGTNNTARFTLDSAGAATFSSGVMAAGLSSVIAKGGSGVESTNLVNIRATGTGAIGDALNVRFLNPDGTNVANISGVLGPDNVAYGSLAFSTRNYNSDSIVEVMRIDNRSRVGIGTTAPTLALSVIGQVRAGYATNAGVTIGLTPGGIPNNDLSAYILWGDNSTFGGENGDLIYIPRTSTTGAHRFYTGAFGVASEKMRITNDGKLLIGSTSDGNTGLVQIHGTARAVQLHASQGGITAGNYAIYGHDDDNGYINIVRSVFTGDFHFRFDGTTRSNINRSTGVYTATSDSRLKTNISDSQNVLSLIDQIKVRSYNWIESNVHEPYGLVAQELHEILPQYVYEPKNENENWGLSKSELVPMLIKAVQELKAELNTANQKITALELAQ